MLRPFNLKLLAKVFLCTVAFSVFSSYAVASGGNITVGYADFPPIAYSSDGEHRGVLLNLMKGVASEAEYSVSFYSLPVNRIAFDIQRVILICG